MNCNAEDLYSQPHKFFNWLMEDTQTNVASKAYIYRKLKELAFNSMINKKKLLEWINSKTSLALGEKLKMLEAHLFAILKFVIYFQLELKIELSGSQKTQIGVDTTFYYFANIYTSDWYWNLYYRYPKTILISMTSITHFSISSKWGLVNMKAFRGKKNQVS